MAKYYSLVPLPQGKFENLALIDRAVFGLIWERWKLSSYKTLGGSDDWYDHDEEEIFCIWSHDELSKQIGTSEKTIRRSLITLREENMISWKKASFKGACRYYIARDIQRYMSMLKQDSRNEQPCP